MAGVNTINLQDDNITEEIILDLRTGNCQFIRSGFYKEQSSINWKNFLDTLIEKQVIYYIDTEKVLQEVILTIFVKC